MYDFYLISTELREPYEPLGCNIIKRLTHINRDDLALVQISPPLNMQVYGTKGPLDKCIIAVKNQGFTLFPVNKWPVPVYIIDANVQIDERTNIITEDKISILDWGEIIKDIHDWKPQKSVK